MNTENVINNDLDAEIATVLKAHNITRINSIADVELLFDLESIKAKSPIIHTDKNSIIIFDHPEYNKAYVHEFFNNVLINKDNISNFLELPNNIPEDKQTEIIANLQNKLNLIVPTVNLYYCNNVSVNETMFKPFFEHMHKTLVARNSAGNPEFIVPEFNYDCPPVILMLNRDVNAIFLDFEKFFPFTVQNALSSFLTIMDAEKINIAQEAEETKIEETRKEVRKKAEEKIAEIKNNKQLNT